VRSVVRVGRAEGDWVDWIRTEVDGVPTYWSPQDGDLRAGLVFRVGQADEPLARRGLTHLVEHLSLHSVGRPHDHVNGEVDATTTTFRADGTAEEVIAFLAATCRSLRDLPTDRLALENQVLRTEAAGRASAPGAPMLVAVRRDRLWHVRLRRARRRPSRT
jgi:zinc protease